jgi:hypothetical protein
MEQYEDARRHRRTWVFERVGWGVMGMVLLGALAGVFGGRHVVLQASDGTLLVELPASWRRLAPLELRVEFRAPGDVRDARLWISRAYLSDVLLEETTPPAGSVELGADRLTHVFDLGPGAGPRTVVMRVRPKRSGLLRGRIGIEGGASIDFEQLILP